MFCMTLFLPLILLDDFFLGSRCNIRALHCSNLSWYQGPQPLSPLDPSSLFRGLLEPVSGAKNRAKNCETFREKKKCVPQKKNAEIFLDVFGISWEKKHPSSRFVSSPFMAQLPKNPRESNPINPSSGFNSMDFSCSREKRMHQRWGGEEAGAPGMETTTPDLKESLGDMLRLLRIGLTTKF